MAGDSPEGAAVGAFVWVIPFKLVAVPLQNGADAFDQPQVALIGVLGDDDFPELWRCSTVGIWIN